MEYHKIKDLREDNDLTQREVAELLKVNRSTYAMWELGDVNFPIEKLALLSNIFHSNLEYLLNIKLIKDFVKYPDDIDYKFIGNKIKEHRIKIGKTQKEFADTLGIRQSSYSYYEDGRTRIPTDRLVMLAKTYHFSLNALLKETKEVINI